jgi:hypothetical protein
MNDIKPHGAALQAKSRAETYCDTLFYNVGQMTALFTAPDAGYTPTFLDIIEACSANVAFLLEVNLKSSAGRPTV